MELTNWWMSIPIVLAVVALSALFLLRDRPADPASGLRAANTERMRRTPRFAQLARQHRLWMLVQVIAIALVVLGASLFSTRLSDAAGSDSEQHNRDIVLCLDVSGSMRDIDAGLMESFAELADDLRGERIGLVIWDSSAVMKFPLTNDYKFIEKQLADGVTAMEKFSYEWSRGTFEGNGSSLIGDGLASCVLRFDRPDEPRARTIILATDNMVNGDAIYTLPQAVQMAQDKEIVVHAIAPRMYDEVREMRKLVAKTGGITYLMDDKSGAEQIVSSIETMDRQRLRGLPTATASDRRAPGLVLVGLGLLALLAAAWRLRQ
ncbi:vWA domain-containing protein [Enemella sp. A6]|uniref:vWA domain-containing protein n=1 Tax=Enemella sp. A6 TaxID=3440152 RepID=UPI003EB7D076